MGLDNLDRPFDYAIFNIQLAEQAINLLETKNKKLIHEHSQVIKNIINEFAVLFKATKKNQSLTIKMIQVITNSKFEEKVDAIAARFERYKNIHFRGLLNNLLVWYSFSNLQDTNKNVLSVAKPLIIDHFSIRSMRRKDNSEYVRAKWGGMSTCTCPKASPKNWYVMADDIAEKLKPLEDDAPVELVHLGSGGCLFNAVLLSRLTRFKNIRLHLIDIQYSQNILGRYDSKNKEDRERIPLNEKGTIVYDHNKSVKSLLRFADSFMPNSIDVRVHQTYKSFLTDRAGESNRHAVLYLEDPEIYPHVHGYPSGENMARQYERIAKELVDNSPSSHFYCLDERYPALELSRWNIPSRAALHFRALMGF